MKNALDFCYFSQEMIFFCGREKSDANSGRILEESYRIESKSVLRG